jgi:hypothetical protein
LKFRNKFIYLDLAKRTVLKEVPNEMFITFSNITKRKFTRYHDPQTGYSYAIRSYLADGVDYDHADNTYIEFFSAVDPYDLQLLKVVDRSYLGLK